MTIEISKFDSHFEISLRQATGVDYHEYSAWRGTVVHLKPEVIDAVRKVKRGAPGSLTMPYSHEPFMTTQMCLLPHETTTNDAFMVLEAVCQDVRYVMSHDWSRRPAYAWFLRLAPIAPNREDRVTSVDSTYLVPYEAVNVSSTCHKDTQLVPGVHYNAPRWIVRQFQIARLDLTVDGFCNEPTACLGVSIPCDAQMMSRVQALKTKKGVINPNRLRKLAASLRMEQLFVTKDNREVDGFPELKLQVNYDELATYFAQYDFG
ncbi:hypothetical protein [Comamonas thiooxydans]|uniref:hypothetical protein n=1 Tax=Comamonas thiooxydans TaxID=363952 RepID=UPI000B42188A|nr:hypothetical protein [Comamonas thiooxydans]